MSTINLKYGKNYHIKKGQTDTLTLEYTDGKSLFSQALTDEGLTSQTVIDFCEERIVLCDGKILKRIRDNLIISN